LAARNAQSEFTSAIAYGHIANSPKRRHYWADFRTKLASGGVVARVAKRTKAKSRWVTHRPQFAITQTRRSCIGRQCEGIIVRRSGVFHRPQLKAVKCVVSLVALGNAWRSAESCVRDQCRTVLGHNDNPINAVDVHD
jgi:hypothetical protein